MLVNFRTKPIRQMLLALGMAVGLTAGLTALLVLAWYWDADRYQALAAGISAAVVLFSVPLAALTVYRDGGHRRADRTIALHDTLTSGEVQAARTRLANLLSREGAAGYVRRAKRSDFDIPPLCAYPSGPDERCDPKRDLRTLLRFFEKAQALHTEGALNDSLFHRLICRHAYWWAMAIPSEPNDPWTARQDLGDIVDWGLRYERAHKGRVDYVSIWAKTRQQNFGSSSPA